ncbi:MAG TPA: pseudouridine synthase [Vicinamibacterales bacterium]
MAHEDDASPGGQPRQGEERPGEAGLGDGERIAKVLARAGVASRREVERLIAAGRVSVNGAPLTTPAVKVSAADRVTLDGRPVKAAEPTRIFRYHKPPGLVTTHRDPQGRPTVFEALPKQLPRLISVGRLDLNSEGLLLLTNDGELTARLTHPRHGIERLYEARVRGLPDQHALDRLASGVMLDGHRTAPASIRRGRPATRDNQMVLLIGIREGRNRQIRRMCDAVGHPVIRLRRVAIGPIRDPELRAGTFRELTAHEVAALKRAGGLGRPQGDAPADPVRPLKNQTRPETRDRPDRQSRPDRPTRPRSPRPSPRDPRRPPPSGAPRKNGRGR